MASGIQFDATTGQWGYDQGNGTWTFPVEDRRQNVINTALNSEGFNGTLPPIENAYRPLEGFFEGRYKMAANGLTDPNASLLDKAFYTVAGAGVLIPSLLEAPVTDLYNFANNASIAGQYAARADLQADPSDATIDRLSAVGCRLSAVVYESQAAGGLLGAASMVPGVVKFGPRINTPDELAAGANGGVAAVEKEIGTTFSTSQLDKKFKHADDFGLSTTKKNPETLAQYQTAIESHLADPSTYANGTYQYVPGSTVHFNPVTNNVVILGKDGSFVRGWKLAPGTSQFDNFIKNGALR